MVYVLTADAKISDDVVKLFTDKRVVIATANMIYNDETCKVKISGLTTLNPNIGNTGWDLPRRWEKLNYELIKKR
jgi:hypothetical protein